jgi:hypothetical protein
MGYAAGGCHDHPGGEAEDAAREGGREAEFDGGEWSGGRIGEQANDQPSDSAGHTSGDSGDACPSNEQWHAACPDGERFHTSYSRISDL